MSIFDKVKETADKAKEVTKKYADDLKQQETKNKKMATAPMEERIKMRPEGVRYCMVNNSGKILDVYENKVIFSSTKSTSTLVTGLIFSESVTQGEKTIYYKDVIGVQYKPSSIADGYIQIETAAGGMTSTSSQYSGENAIQFSGKKNNEEAEIIVSFIRKQVEEIKNAPAGGGVQQISTADELKKYKELLDDGILTQEEFDVKKKQLLGL